MTVIVDGFSNEAARNKAKQSLSAVLLAFLTDGKKPLLAEDGSIEDNFYIFQFRGAVRTDFITASDAVEEAPKEIGEHFFWHALPCLFQIINYHLHPIQHF